MQATAPPSASWGLCLGAQPVCVCHPTSPGSADGLAGAAEDPGAQSPGHRAPDTHCRPGLFAQQRACQTHFPRFQPFLNQIYLISHLYFGRGKNAVSNLKFKKPSPSSKCTQLRWCLGNYLCHSHTHRHVAQQWGQALPPRTLHAPPHLPREVALSLPVGWGPVGCRQGLMTPESRVKAG